jgi:hypothetical protein
MMTDVPCCTAGQRGLRIPRPAHRSGLACRRGQGAALVEPQRIAQRSILRGRSQYGELGDTAETGQGLAAKAECVDRGEVVKGRQLRGVRTEGYCTLSYGCVRMPSSVPMPA